MQIANIDIEQLTWQYFKKHLRLQGRSYQWLADNMNLGYQHTYRLLNGKRSLKEKHKQILIELLEIPTGDQTT